MCVLNRLALCALLLVAFPSASPADWGWYRGDIATFSAANTSTSVSESVHQAVESGLDWVVLSAPPQTGAFVGLNEIVEEIQLTVPRLTPILGTSWHQDGYSLRVLGMDARAPLPLNLPDLLITVATHRGVAILEDLGDDLPSLPEVSILSPLVEGKWHTAVSIGGMWDRALTQGRRVFIAGTSAGTHPAHTHETTVWAEGNQADQIIKALREGSAYVSDKEGIRLDFQVNGRTFGQTVFYEGEAFVRIRAYSKHPISSVMLIANGKEIWSAEPHSTLWEERFFLPGGDYGYVRAILYSEEGDTRTLGNPIFLISENLAPGELPLAVHPPLPTDDLIELGGVIEALSGLSKDAQIRILREFLSSVATRYGTCWLLQNRSDIISDGLLAELAGRGESDQVRLGAAYALVTRGSDLAPDLLLQFLNSHSAELQSYAARIFAQYTEGFTEEDWSWDPHRSPEANAFLIRAYHPARHSEQMIAQIVNTLNADHRALRDAASDKLVELGTRHYRVIQVLLDSTRAGLAAAADVLGMIGDHRTITALQRVFSETAKTDLKRSVFLALAHMGAPYPNRRSVDLPELSAPPQIDGTISPDEWEGAADLQELRSDWDGGPADIPVRVRVGKRADSVYIAVSKAVTDRLPVSTLTDAPETTILRDDHVEISLAAPPYDRAEFGNRTHIRINALGVIDCIDPIPCRAVSRVTASSWEIECVLPLEALHAYPRFNLAVVSQNETPGRLAWSVTYGEPDDPSRYGDLRTEVLSNE